MAESIFNARAAERRLEAHAESGGLLGVGAVHPMVLRCIEELGVSSEGMRPKQVTKEMVDRAETIVGFGGINPERNAVKFGITEQWDIENPSGLSYGKICELRDDIARSVDDLLDRCGSKSRA